MNDEKAVDALGYSRVLLDALAECSRCFGYPDLYLTAVDRLRHDCPNIPNGPQLKTLIDEYVNGRWHNIIMKDYNEWQESNPLVYGQDADTEMALIRSNHMVELCDFIRQLLMDCDCIRNFYSGGEHD